MILKRFLMILSPDYFRKSFPENLRISGRGKLTSDNFLSGDKLFRSFKKTDLDSEKHLKPETIKFPDVSCNWSKFSKPCDIWFRDKGSAKDGCYSFSVEDSRFNKTATPVHDPIFENDPIYIENYSHTELRVLPEGKDFLFEPDKGRKINSKSKKLEYRMHIREVCKIEIKAW